MHSFVVGRGGGEGGEGAWTGKSKTAYFYHSFPTTNFFLGTSAKFRKTTIRFIVSVCPSFHKEQLGFHWKVFLWKFDI
jgi:hypothetical protein